MDYKQSLAKQTGAMGPTGSATWPKLNATTGAIYTMGAAPLIYNTTTGMYNTAYDANAAIASPSFSFGRRRSIKRKKRKSSKRKKRKGSKRKKRSVKRWKNQSTKQRKRIMSKCGPKCFLSPGNRKFPICNPDCTINPYGLEAAYKRARQWGYTDIAKKAKRHRYCQESEAYATSTTQVKV
jgi:hypothetical protein